MSVSVNRGTTTALTPSDSELEYIKISNNLPMADGYYDTLITRKLEAAIAFVEKMSRRF